jgi:hypothetical protein
VSWEGEKPPEHEMESVEVTMEGDIPSNQAHYLYIWCAPCVAFLIERGERGEVLVFDWLTMDDEE